MIDALAASTDRALFRDVTAWDVEAVTSDPDDLEHGFHVVVQTFEGELLAARMRSVVWHPTQPWRGSAALAEPQSRPAECHVEWRSSLSRDAYCDGVERIREHIAAGDVYQVNLCRTLTTDAALDLDVLFRGVLAHNPARHAARIDIAGLPQIVSASPEMYLAREGAVISSAPIKGTSTCPETMLAKDVTENVMITDLVRNDLQRVCVPGSVRVDPLLEMQQHPGLVHLVSTVWGEVCDDVTWARLLSATGPPGSVSGTRNGGLSTSSNHSRWGRAGHTAAPSGGSTPIGAPRSWPSASVRSGRNLPGVGLRPRTGTGYRLRRPTSGWAPGSRGIRCLRQNGMRPN